jgi:polysaccharide pyruvyl transferase WcaK-like protein
MTILVDSCSYTCQNVGDLAMLTVAISRLRQLWPAARIRVITDAPAVVKRQCGKRGAVETVPVRGRRLLLNEGLLGRMAHHLPERAAVRWRTAEEELRLRLPGLFGRSLKWKATLRGDRGNAAGDADAFLTAVQEANLVVVNGAGVLTDAFKENALGILATLDLAIHRQVPTAMFGQGFGPMVDRDLRRRAEAVLPNVTLIGIREQRASLPFLLSLGVDPSRVLLTGDDALELACDAEITGSQPGSEPKAIGVNVRVAPYANIERETLAAVRQAIESTAQAHAATLLPIPIARHGGGMDIDTLRVLLSGIGADETGGASLDTPERVIERIAKCRVVVTGSYHGAVFALAQGIPVVALARSAYYLDKMVGLADQFGAGCEVVEVCLPGGGDPAIAELAGRVRSAIARAWESADDLRETILDAARRQIQQGRQAYARLQRIVDGTFSDPQVVERGSPAVPSPSSRV